MDVYVGMVIKGGAELGRFCLEIGRVYITDGDTFIVGDIGSRWVVVIRRAVGDEGDGWVVTEGGEVGDVRQSMTMMMDLIDWS